MCIIAVKLKNGNLPSKKEVMNCFENNDDGAGLMYTNNGKVIIEKGFMTLSAFMKRYDELCTEFNNFEGKSLVMHFRIGTQGKNDEHTCHPFPITSKHKFLRRTNMETDVAMVHNGIIGEFSGASKWSRISPKDSLLSDTQLFIRYCVASFKSLNRQFYKNPQVMEYLDRVCGGKLAFLDKDDDVYMLGDFVYNNGTFYSNTSYSYSYVYNYSSHKYELADPYNYKDWYDEEDDDKIGGSIPKKPQDIEINTDYVGRYEGCEPEWTTVDEVLPGETLYLIDGDYKMTVFQEYIYFTDDEEGVIYQRDKDNKLRTWEEGYSMNYLNTFDENRQEELVTLWG